MTDENLKAEEAVKEGSGWELVRFAFFAFLVVVPVRLWIAQPFIVSGSSMVPTFEDKNYLIVDEISYRLGEPERDDVVIFRYPNDPKKYFIKRIIGLPNETVDIAGTVVTITNDEHEDGLVLMEPYVKNPSQSQVHVTLDDDEYFVMGDNRAASSDSRVWGPVTRDLIIGRALLRLWPLHDLDLLPGKYTREE